MTLVEPPAGCIGTSLLLNHGSMLNATYDAINDVIVYDVCVQPNTWFAIGYGSSMTNTDMVWWSGNGTYSSQLDLYSTGTTTPNIDPVNYYNTTWMVNGDGSTTFRSTRPLNVN